MEYFRQFLNSPGVRGERPPELHLTIFGKHPGWNDHIPDHKLVTDTLALLKSALYVRGIGGVIDSGVWENLAPEHFIEDFNHVFIAQRRGEWIYGRMWASADGKRRARYPMCVVVHGIGVPLDRALNRLTSAIDSFRDRCISYTTAEEVFALVDDTELELQGLTRDLISGGDQFIPSRRPLDHLLQSTLVDPAEHRRLLYEISNQLVPFSPGKANLTVLDNSESGEHLRVPTGDFSPPDESLLAWITYLRTQIDGAVPIMLFRPVNYEWIDVIIGIPNASNLVCLKSDLPRTPLITAIQFNLPEGFSERADAIIEKIGSWENDPAEGSILGAPPKEKLGRRFAKAASGVTRPPFAMPENDAQSTKANLDGDRLEKREPPYRLIGLIAGCILILLVLLVLFFRGGDDADVAEAVSSVTNRSAAPIVSAPTVVDSSMSPALEAWNYLEAASVWYPRFLRLARARTVQEKWGKFPEIAEFLAWIETREFRDPRETVGQRSTMDAVALAALQPDQRARLLELEADVRELESRIRGWALLKSADALRELSRANQWNEINNALNRDFPPLIFDRDLGNSLSARLEKSAQLSSTAAEWAVYSAQRDRLLSVGAQCVSEFIETKQALLKGVTSLAALEARLVQLSQDFDRVGARLAGGPQSIDFAALESDARYSGATPLDRANLLPALLEEFTRLPENPLTRFDIDSTYSENDYKEHLKALRELDASMDLQPFEVRWKELVSSAGRLSQIPRLARNRGDIESRESALRSAGRDLRNDLSTAVASASRPTEWHAGLAAVELDAPLLNDAWKSRFAVLISPTELATLEGDIEAYRERRRLVGKWLEAYQAVDDWILSAPWSSFLGEADTDIQKVFGVVLAERFTRESIKLLESIGSASSLQETQPVEAIRAWQASALNGATDLFELATDLSIFAWALGLPSPIVAPPGLNARLERYWQNGNLPPVLSHLRQAAHDVTVIETAKDPGLLLGFLSTQEHLALRAASWGRLQVLEKWPRNVQELKQVLSFAQSVDLGEALQREVVGQLPALWHRTLIAARGRDARKPVWELQEVAGVAPDDLTVSERFESIIVEALDEEFLLTDAEAARAVADRTLMSLSSLPTSVTHDPAVVAFMSGLEILPLSGSAMIEPQQLAGTGPARIGWEMIEADAEGAWVRYEWASDHLRREENRDAYVLVFKLVELENGERCYLSCDEISAGLFFDWLNEQRLWSEVRPFFPDLAFGSEDPGIDLEWRSGARTWELSKSGEYQPPFDWQLQTNTTGIPLTPALKVAPPSRFTPVTHLSAAAASGWSDSVGCRLPTVAEWLTVAKSEAHMPELANLRDRSWELQQEYLGSGEVSGFLGRSWLDTEIFVSKESNAPTRADAMRASDTEDGFVWFRPVPAEPVSRDSFRDLRGNVSEWLNDPNGGYAVAGASALSSKEILWNVPLSLPRSDSRRFSDVGFRLAFDAPTPLPGRVLRAALAAAPDVLWDKSQ